jgi:hypothetical protein
MQVRPRVARTRFAAARCIERLIRDAVDAATEVELAARRERDAVLCERGRHDAVEHVDAAVHGLEQIERRADAHQVTRLVGGQQRRGQLGHVLALRTGLADGEAADRVAVEAKVDDLLRAGATKILVARALHDPEHRLRRACHRGLRAYGPRARDLDGRRRIRV